MATTTSLQKELQKELVAIKERNKRVEADKAWETSWTRRIIIAVLTYLVIALFFWMAKMENPLANAIIATAAFLLSTSTLGLFKKWWLARRKSKK